MTAPVVEIVAPADPAPMTGAMVTATAEGLPSNARILVVERPSGNADVVVRLRWADDGRRHATLIVRASDGRETERTLTFAAADPETERGRALGFAVAAMVPEDLRGAPGDEPPPIAPTPPPKPAAPPSAPPPAPRPIEAPHEREARPGESVWFEANAQASAGVGGSAGGIGGGIAVRVPFSFVALRIGGDVRAGSVGEAAASSTVLRGDAGVSFFTVVVDPRVLAGARTGLVLLHHALERTEADGSKTSGTHTLLGAEAMIEGSFALAPRFSLIAAAGTEIAFGSTHVLVGPTRVTEIPAVRLVAEAGARVAF